MAPFFPGLPNRTILVTFPAASWVASAVDVACCVVVAAKLATAPCTVDALFAAFEEATVMLFCVIGPSFPGLLMRTITTTLIGCC
jgi:hypothetical protein